MTQKEFIGKLACKLQLDESKISEVLGAISNILADQILNNNEIKIEDFGIFNTHKYNEYILVDSNTGERFLMPPEVVVSFEPFVDESLESNSQLVDISFEVDDLLKSKINSAFHNFEPTLINEGVEFPGIEVITTEEDVIEIEDRETVVSESEKEIESKDSDFQVSLDAYAQSDLLTELKIDSERHPTPVLRPDKCSRPKSRPREGSRILFPVLGGVVIVMATLFFSMAWQTEKTMTTVKELKTESSESVNKSSELVNQSSESVNKSPELVNKKKIIVDEDNKIVSASKSEISQPESLIIGEGETLRTIALELFGNKEFWVYIYLENIHKIKNPNVLPIGIELIIPDILKCDINADNPQSIAKAKEKGDWIIKTKVTG